MVFRAALFAAALAAGPATAQVVELPHQATDILYGTGALVRFDEALDWGKLGAPGFSFRRIAQQRAAIADPELQRFADAGGKWAVTVDVMDVTDRGDRWPRTQDACADGARSSGERVLTSSLGAGFTRGGQSVTCVVRLASDASSIRLVHETWLIVGEARYFFFSSALMEDATADERERVADVLAGEMQYWSETYLAAAPALPRR